MKYMLLRTCSKGDAFSARKHKAGVAYGRDPMRCPPSMMGLYFAYGFFQAGFKLPDFDDLDTTLYDRSLFRKRKVEAGESDAKNVSSFNPALKKHLHHIGAKDALGFTLYGWRNLRIKEASENTALGGCSIVEGNLSCPAQIFFLCM